MQRSFDIFFSLIAIIFLSPLLSLVIIILRLTGEGEIFFVQSRIGLNQSKFGLIKFATMKKDSPNIGAGNLTIKDDPRVLPFGKYLRKTKINELPQLFNIFRGEMSLIGPRPLTKISFDAYDRVSQDIISKVPPGLSGLGSIFFRDEESMLKGESVSIDLYNRVIAPYKASLEIWYVRNRSIKLYFTLIISTLWVVLRANSNVTEKWKIFQDIPKPRKELKDLMKYDASR